MRTWRWRSRTSCRKAASTGVSVLFQKDTVSFLLQMVPHWSQMLWFESSSLGEFGSIWEETTLAFTFHSLFVEESCHRLNKHVRKCLLTNTKSRSNISLSSYHIFVRNTSFPSIVKVGVATSCFFVIICLTFLIVSST